MVSTELNAFCEARHAFARLNPEHLKTVLLCARAAYIAENAVKKAPPDESGTDRLAPTKTTL